MISLYHGDCLEVMKSIPDHSVDLILTDPPYQVTRAKTDIIIPFEPMWKQFNRIAKMNAAMILFGQDKFTAKLMLSNEKNHRYNLIWKKVLTSGFLNANRMPLREHEDICVFYRRLPTYNPQKVKGKSSHSKGKAVGKLASEVVQNHNYGDYQTVETISDMKFPTSILEFPKPHPSICKHPTEKPVALLEWLIKTYSNEGDVVLDCCMGSGSTGEAALKCGRGFVGIEKDEEYFEVAKKRIKDLEKEINQ